MTGLPDKESGNDFIRGLATNPCINGITKADALEIQKIPELESETNEIVNNAIPSLDERITALENGGSGTSEWIKFTNQNTINDIIDLTSFKSIKDIKIIFYSTNQGGSWVTQIEKNTYVGLLKFSNLEFYCFPNDDSSVGNYFAQGIQFSDSVFQNLSMFDVNSYPLKAYHLTIDSTNISKISWTGCSFYYDDETKDESMTIYYKN